MNIKDTHNDLVSVIICTYNGEKYLKAQVDSICNQTYINLEIIILDDCSTDLTVAIANEYTTLYSNIKVIVNEVNIGVDKNMEQGFILAKGKYICPSDQDDVWKENKIEVLVNLIKENKCSLVYCNGYFTDENMVKIKHEKFGDKPITENDLYPFISGKNYQNLLIYNCISGHAMLFEKELGMELIPFDLKVIYYDQWLGIAALLRKGVSFTTEPLVYFRRHTTAVTHHMRTHLQYYNHIKNVLACLVSHPFFNTKQKKYVNTLFYLFDNNEKIINKFRLWWMISINILSLYKIRGKSTLSNLFYARKVAFRFSKSK